ncbi:hypothetical protein OH782_41720 (plasmid) [Streptomyces sp. NBC_01544]|uniref:hypothetical protein n=1 Tax=unclassified Streptomyces TaxID=2593676 RepID=UPI0030E1D625
MTDHSNSTSPSEVTVSGIDGALLEKARRALEARSGAIVQGDPAFLINHILKYYVKTAPRTPPALVRAAEEALETADAPTQAMLRKVLEREARLT